MGVRHLQRDANQAGDGAGKSRNFIGGGQNPHKSFLRRAGTHQGVDSFSKSARKGMPGPSRPTPGGRIGADIGAKPRGQKNVRPFRMGQTNSDGEVSGR